MHWSDVQVGIGKDLYWAIRRHQHSIISDLCDKNNWLVVDHMWDGDIWLSIPACDGNVKMISLLIDIGFNINSLRMPEESSAVSYAIDFNHWNVLNFLLAKGADPKLGRPIIGALNIGDPADRRRVVAQLLDHGVDINKLYPLYGDQDNLFTALDCAGSDEGMVVYLRSRGAKTAQELGHASPPATGPAAVAEAVVAHFTEHFGPVQRKSLVELVPTGHPVALHVIPPGDGRDHVTFFTTGMSDRPLNVQAGQEEYRYAELYIQLPATWPLTAAKLATAKFGWPLTWLRAAARHPHDQDEWAGGPVAFVVNGDPPARLAPTVPFTALLLFATDVVTLPDAPIVQLYRITPIYTDELELVTREGVAALLAAFDRHGVSMVVDSARQTAVLV